MKQIKVAALSLIAASMVAMPMASHAADLGDYNALFFGNFNSSGSDTEGRLAVGGNATLNSYDVGLKRSAAVPSDSSSRNTLLVGGDLSWNQGGGGQVHGGDVRVGGTSSLANVSIPDGSLVQGGIAANYFSSAQSSYRSLSTQLAGLGNTAGSTVTYAYGGITLSGTNSNLSVFNVDGNYLNSANTLNISGAANSTVLINVSGTADQMKYMGINLSGVDKQHVLFNFANATSLNFDGVGINGSILAPNADITSGYHNFDGQIIANSFTGHGQINNFAFQGNVTQAVPEPTSMAALGIGLISVLRRRKKAAK